MSEENVNGTTEPAESVKEVSDKSYTTADVERIVKDRLARDRKERKAETPADQAQKPKASGSGVEEELRGKLAQYDTLTKTMESKLTAMRDNQLKTTIENECIKAGCNDPELLTTYFLTKKAVRFGDDDSLVVDNLSGSLTDLVKDELAKRPHLAKPTQVSGMGSKATGAPKVPSGKSIKDMSPEEYAAHREAVGIKTPGGKFKLF